MMMAHRFALIGLALVGATHAGSAFAQTYIATPTIQSDDQSAAEATQRRKVIANRKRIAAQEASRPSSVHLNTAGAGSTSAQELARNGGLPTAGLGRRSIPIARENNRAPLVPQR